MVSDRRSGRKQGSFVVLGVVIDGFGNFILFARKRFDSCEKENAMDRIRERIRPIDPKADPEIPERILRERASASFFFAVFFVGTIKIYILKYWTE